MAYTNDVQWDGDFRMVGNDVAVGFAPDGLAWEPAGGAGHESLAFAVADVDDEDDLEDDDEELDDDDEDEEDDDLEDDADDEDEDVDEEDDLDEDEDDFDDDEEEDDEEEDEDA